MRCCESATIEVRQKSQSINLKICCSTEDVCEVLFGSTEVGSLSPPAAWNRVWSGEPCLLKHQSEEYTGLRLVSAHSLSSQAVWHQVDTIFVDPV